MDPLAVDSGESSSEENVPRKVAPTGCKEKDEDKFLFFANFCNLNPHVVQKGHVPHDKTDRKEYLRLLKEYSDWKDLHDASIKDLKVQILVSRIFYFRRKTFWKRG